MKSNIIFGAIIIAALFCGVCSKPEKIVLETMDAGGYTYAQVWQNGKKIWLAGPLTKLSKGDKIDYPEGMVMKNFKSPTLNREFEEIVFLPYINLAGSKGAAVSSQAETSQTPADLSVKAGSIPKAAGGLTVGECYEKKNQYAGKVVSVTGKIVKYSEKIMGKNWIHLTDGTGQGTTGKLVATTSQTAKIGDIVTAKGKITLDKNLGSGYNYPVLMEDTTFQIIK